MKETSRNIYKSISGNLIFRIKSFYIAGEFEKAKKVISDPLPFFSYWLATEHTPVSELDDILSEHFYRPLRECGILGELMLDPSEDKREI